MSPKSLERIVKGLYRFPESPGVYIIRGLSGTPIYIGKARSLRHRLKSHFAVSAAKEFKERLIQRDAQKIDVIQTTSEAEALLLESSLVKEHRPRYNKELKDDKSYPFLKVTLNECFPRLLIVRGRKSDGSLYFGPYTSAHLLRQAVSLLRRLFPMRTCHPLPKKVCLMYHIGQCKAPCENLVDKKEYKTIVRELSLFLNGKKDVLIRHLAKRMKEASSKQAYEEAKVYRDQMKALTVVSVMHAPLNRRAVLEQMRKMFGLNRYPKRIEAFDISNFSGKNAVGSLIVFEEGEPKTSDYRKFKIKTVEGIDDYQMMREVVRRRYERLLNEKKPLPDLVLIDGGKGHLSSIKEEFDRLNLGDLDLLSIAKQHEHIFSTARPNPYVLPLDSNILKLIRHLRDEAHRFAISFYRKLHRKKIAWSELNEVPGVGDKSKNRLMKAFKSITAIKALSWKELAQVEGIDKRRAKTIEQYFKSR
jgi:excinuclease ABC subunit C